MEPGNCLVLTKPLGTQLATNAYLWMIDNHQNYQRLISVEDGKDAVTDEDIISTYKRALDSMISLNRKAAELMRKYNARGSTDITGFGLIGHTKNLLEHQLNQNLAITIHTIPLFKNISKMSKKIGHFEKYRNGNGVETSGGLLVALPDYQTAQLFSNELPTTSWIVGSVGVRESPECPLVVIDPDTVKLIED